MILLDIFYSSSAAHDGSFSQNGEKTSKNPLDYDKR
jgi:hypothetical protein